MTKFFTLWLHLKQQLLILNGIKQIYSGALHRIYKIIDDMEYGEVEIINEDKILP